jgi:hypothetical protein
LLKLLGVQPFRPWPADALHHPTDRRWHHAEDGTARGSHRRLVEHLYQHPEDLWRVPTAPQAVRR